MLYYLLCNVPDNSVSLVFTVKIHSYFRFDDKCLFSIHKLIQAKASFTIQLIVYY